MSKLVKAAGLFIGGWLFGAYVQNQDIESGEVIHNDKEMYVKASKNKSMGYSLAKVVYKNPEKL